MGKNKAIQREAVSPRLIKTTSVTKNDIELWKDINIFFPLLNSQYAVSAGLAGIISIIISFIVFSNPSSEHLNHVAIETNINLSTQSYSFNYHEAIQQRLKNMKKYDHKYVLNKVERRSGLSLQEFWDIYDAKWPVILTDVMTNWPAINWTNEYFYRNYGDERVTMKAVYAETVKGLALPLKTFIEHVNESSQLTWTYVEDELFIPHRPELYKQVPSSLYTEENFFNLFPVDIKPWDCMFLWGTQHSRSLLHMDPYNWTGTNAVIKGHKKWKLFPPGQDDLLYLFPDLYSGFPLNCKKHNSPIDTFAPDLQKFPKYKSASYIEVDQYPGEFLIIPSGWFHQAYNMKETIAISGQYMNRNNYLIVLEEILTAGNLKRRKLPSYFHHLMPPDQVTHLLSLLPKEILAKGRKINKMVADQLKITNNQK